MVKPPNLCLYKFVRKLWEIHFEHPTHAHTHYLSPTAQHVLLVAARGQSSLGVPDAERLLQLLSPLLDLKDIFTQI